MTPAAIVLAIVVAAGQAQDPEVAAMVAAAVEAVGAADAVRLIEGPRLDDAEALRVEHELPARAVVQLSWVDPGRLTARLRLHAARTDRWIDRTIHFSSADVRAERGRALGFAIASMLPEGDPELRAAAMEPVAPAPPPVAPEPPLGRQAAELAVLTAAGLGGSARGVGGALRLERFITEHASLGASLSTRVGSIPALDVGTVTTALGVGGAWWPLPASAAHRLGVGLRVEALLLYHAVSHERASGTTEWKDHLLPGATAQVEVTWRLLRGLELLVSAGMESAFGTIDVTVAPPSPSSGAVTIPALRALGSGGIRSRF